MNAYQRRIARRLYERAFGNHVDYLVTINLYPNKTDGHNELFVDQHYPAMYIQRSEWIPSREANDLEDEAAVAK